MSSDFSIESIGGACEITTGFPFKSSGYCDKSESVKLLRGDNIAQGCLRWDGVKRWNTDELERSVEARYSLRSGDVVIAMDRPWIEAGLKFAAIQDSDLPCLLVQRVARLRAGGKVDQGFLKYVVSDYAFTSHVLAVQTGTAVPHISSKQIAEYMFAAPPLGEQKAIAHILGTLDDKIELNRKTNETLEAMAKTLFKSWFVDFDPVRAKAEGRPTGLPAEISDLFPDSFEDSELGEIPSGWKISNLGSLIKQCGEPIQASSTTMELPYVPIDCISNKSLALREYKSGAEANTSLLLFREGDLLFGAMRPYFHKVCIAPFDGTTRTTCFALRPFTDSHYAFVAMLLSAASTIEYATLHSTGSTIPYIRWSNGLENMLSIQPPYPILDCFNKTALPILRKISISLFTERPIAAVRDILLPKLISGEIRIPDAEKMLEEVGV